MCQAPGKGQALPPQRGERTVTMPGAKTANNSFPTQPCQYLKEQNVRVDAGKPQLAGRVPPHLAQTHQRPCPATRVILLTQSSGMLSTWAFWVLTSPYAMMAPSHHLTIFLLPWSPLRLHYCWNNHFRSQYLKHASPACSHCDHPSTFWVLNSTPTLILSS